MEELSFLGSQGHKLSAKVDYPDSDIVAYALFAHCFTCSKDMYATSRISKALNKDGIAVLRFDFTGLGSSEGEFENTNFTSNVEDLVKAADYMRENLSAPSIIIGHSLGGAAVLMAAKDIPEVKAVVTIGAPANVEHVSHHFSDQHEEIMEKGVADVCLGGRPFRIQKQFIDDVTSQDSQENIANLGKALLVMHAPLDATVGVENAAQIFGAAKHPKSYVSLGDADHLMTKRKDAEYAARVIAAWSSRFIERE